MLRLFEQWVVEDAVELMGSININELAAASRVLAGATV